MAGKVRKYKRDAKGRFSSGGGGVKGFIKRDLERGKKNRKKIKKAGLNVVNARRRSQVKRVQENRSLDKLLNGHRKGFAKRDAKRSAYVSKKKGKIRASGGRVGSKRKRRS